MHEMCEFIGWGYIVCTIVLSVLCVGYFLVTKIKERLGDK
jgi:hypothetical protein